MRKRLNIPPVLTVAGSDSGGGAGIQADLKTFAALRCHGLTAITSITAQNPRGVTDVQACTPRVLQAQLEAVAAFKPRAAKTGMLLSRRLIEVVADFFAQHSEIPLVLDPVMIATSGASLLRANAVKALSARLIPLASIITPNVQEAEALTGATIRNPEDLRRAARKLHSRFGCAALVKGGHLATGGSAVDIYFDGSTELLLEASRARGVATHGTGCTYSAAIAALIARGHSRAESVQGAKQFITGAIHGSIRAGSFDVLNPFYTAGPGPNGG